MKVEELIIDGFKSYATRTVISGWDPQFNAITGLNGSGKSNILDAICFVLGIASMSTVRASNLQDLIYKRGQAGVTKASVTIVFDNSEVSKSPIGFETYAKISVTRQIILGGTSKYLVNGHKAQQQVVLNLFQSVQLNINNPNFLIMQGKITKVLNMKPQEILLLIEEAAGTRTFEDRKDKAQRTMAKKESKLVEIRTLLKEEIEPKLEKLRQEKRYFLEFQQIQTDLENMLRLIAAHDYLKYSARFNEHSTMLNERELIMQTLNDTVTRLKSEIHNLNEDLENVKRQRENELKNDEINGLEEQEAALLDELTRLNTLKEIAAQNLREEASKLKKLQQTYEALQQALENSLDLYANYEGEYQAAKQHLQQLKEEFNKKEELLSTLSTGVSAKGNTDGGYMSQLKEVKAKMNESQVFIQRLQLQITHLKESIEAARPKLASAQQETAELTEKIRGYEAKIQEKDASLKALGYDPERVAELRKEHSEVEGHLHKLDGELGRLQRDLGNVDFVYSKPYPEFNDAAVRGIAGQLFELQEQHLDKAVALQACAGGRIFNVVVDTSDVALALLERGQLRKRVTIIPLDKINSKVVPPKTVDTAKDLCPGKVELALNLVNFEEELVNAMGYIFGSTFVCDDPDTANAVTFNPQVRTRSITLEGDVYDPEGNLSGGSRLGNSNMLVNMQQYARKKREWQAMSTRLGEIEAELSHFERLSELTRLLENEVNLQKHELLLLQRKLDNNPSAVILRENDTNQQQIHQLEEQVRENEEKIAEYQEKIKVIETDMKEFSSDKGSKLKQLQKEVEGVRERLLEEEQKISDKAERYQSIQIEAEQHRTELAQVTELIEGTNLAIAELQKQVQGVDSRVMELSEELELVRASLEDERASLLGLNEEMGELGRLVQHKTHELHEAELQIQKLNHDLEKSTATTSHLRDKLDAIIGEFEWVTDSNVVNSITQQYPGVNLDELHDQAQVLQERFSGMKRKVNTDIMHMIDNVEKKETSLRTMIRTIEKDKAKIENTIDKLNGYKRDTLNQTYLKVSEDFGQVFADLLPGSFAKLVPVSEEDVTKGLEVKVKLGPVWKASLVELSGGQRSLIALSLIMALLQFKPAPMYILDEVDAALDLSHTQNIGHLIKTRFKGSQFIVVSLKEGMFTNANRVFRTRFQDGTSVVSVM